MTRYTLFEQWRWLDEHIANGLAVQLYADDLWIDLPSAASITNRSRQRLAQLTKDKALRARRWRNTRLINVPDLINYINRDTYQEIEKARGNDVKPFKVYDDEYDGI